MNTQTEYFSIVSNRINELKSRLLQVENQLRVLNRNSKLRKQYSLEKEFLLRKINYLEKIINLPLFMFINSLSENEMSRIQSKVDSSVDKNSLIALFGLNEISKNFGKSKVMTMAYIKDSFIDDYNFMTTLLDLHRRNFDLSNRKVMLCDEGTFGFQSFRELNQDEVKLHRFSNKLDNVSEMLRLDYSEETLREIYEYIKNPNKQLSQEFISRHRDRVSKLNSRNGKLKSGISSLVRKVFNLKRNRKEEAFLNSIIESYKQDEAVRFLGLENIDFNTIKKSDLKAFPKKVRKQVLFKQNETARKIKENSESRSRTLKEFQKCDVKKRDYFNIFKSMLHSKCSYVPKIFEEQMWNEPDLKDSLIREACYLEESALVEEISRQLSSESTYVIIDSIEFDSKDVAIRSLVA